MRIENFSGDKRVLRKIEKGYDLVVVGGGLAGVCCAITAAREGVKVALVQDRPVLGGNASSEVRLWALGATSHMGNNNRWSREGGVIDELLVENTYRNKEGNPVFFDALLYDKVIAEPNIDLMLNTVVYDIEKSSADTISKVFAFNPQNSTLYTFTAPLFADCSGDGIVGYLSGATYRVGAEDRADFNEKFTQDPKEYGEMLGHSILLYMKDNGNPVSYVAPDFALKGAEKHIAKLQRNEYFNLNQHGCKYWWLEYGARLDTVHDTEEIKHEIWKVIYGIWDYVKNSGKFPEAANLTLEWVGLIPGKRESRRFVGYTTLVQQDLIEQREHYDAVAFGGWSIDLHPADGLYSEKNGCNQWHSKGVFQIPYRIMLTPDIKNLFLGGRIVSASHVAYGSTRVMCTTAHCGQALAVAAALCREKGVTPDYFIDPKNIGELQQRLLAGGQHLPMIGYDNAQNKACEAKVSVSSSLSLEKLPFDGDYFTLDYPVAQMIPVNGKMPRIKISAKSTQDTTLEIQLRASSKLGNYTPDVTLETLKVDVAKGVSEVVVDLKSQIAPEQYVFVAFMTNPAVSIRTTNVLMTGLLSVFNYMNPAVSNYGKQVPPEDSGIDEFEFWCPKRRPQGQNIAMEFSPAIDMSSVERLLSGEFRPTTSTNAWIAAIDDRQPELKLEWSQPQAISSVKLMFDTDFDHAMEQVQMGHHDWAMPMCARRFEILADGKQVAQVDENHLSMREVRFDKPVSAKTLTVKFEKTLENVPVSVMGIIVK